MTARRVYTICALALVLGLGALIRIFKLGQVPAGFFCDEAAFGVNAYSILTSGKDEFGRSYPLFFRSFGDYKEAIPTYSVVPLVYAFGLNEWSVRLMSVIYGMINLALMYAIGSSLKGPRLGVLTAFAAALMPWMFHYDRVAFHCSPYLTTMLSAIFLLLSAQHHHPVRISGFLMFLGLSLYTYSPAKLMAPLLFIAGLCVYWRYLRAHWDYLLLGIIVLGIIVLPVLQAISSGEALARAGQLGLLRTGSPSGAMVAKWVSNYRVQILPSTLFMQGEPTAIHRHLTNFFPPLLISTAPFLVLGIAQLIRKARQPSYLFLLICIVMFPLGATLTGAPFTHRSILGAPLAALSIALGLEAIFSIGSTSRGFSRLMTCSAAVCIIAIAINAASYFQRYLFAYPLTSSDYFGWQYGPREIIGYFRQHEEEYDELIVPGRFNAPRIFFRFYAPDGLCVDRCFVGDVSLFNPEKRQLFALTPIQVTANEMRFDFSNRHTIAYPNGETAFVLGTLRLRDAPGP